MKVLAHHDPCVLEAELLRRLHRAHPADAVVESLVLVPTARLAAHLQHRLATGFARSAWLGVRVLTFHAAARTILAARPAAVPASLSPRLREALVRRVARELPDNVWSRFAARRPGALRRLATALNDLRDAGLAPRELEASVDGAREGDLAGLYRRYVEVLERQLARGRADDAGLVRLALPHAARFARDRRVALVHGAYELIGVHLELLCELDRGTEVILLAPFSPGAAATAYAEAFVRRHLDAREVVAIDASADRGCGLVLESLYDEPSRPPPAAPGRLRFRHVQGPLAEVQAAVRSALRAIADGERPREVALVARSLEPYSSALEAVLDDGGLNWTSSLGVPLRRRPVVRDLLRVIGVVAEDFPRRDTVELLRSPRIRWRRLSGESAVPAGDLADRWSRRAGVVEGLEDWTRDLPRWVRGNAERRLRDDPGIDATALVDEAERVGRALRRLHERLAPQARTWRGHAERLRGLVDELLTDAGRSSLPAPDLEALAGLLDDMAALDEVEGGAGPVPFAAMRDWLEEAASGAETEARAEDGGGIRVLDAMQFRGLTFERVFVLGMNAKSFPAVPRQDPVLADSLRIRLRERTRRPLPVRSERSVEERLLLSMLLGGSRSATVFSWQRADDSGRARSISLALRELARLAYGRPDLERVVGEAHLVPSHPEHGLRDAAEDPGLLSPEEATLLTALAGRGADALDGLAAAHPELVPSLDTLRATQEFVTVDPRYDARLGRGVLGGAPLSVSGLEMLGRCPLQFFFRHVLGIREPDRETGPLGIDSAEVGTRVHELLERVYRTLSEEGRFEDADEGALLARADGLLAVAGGGMFGSSGERLARRYPVLWESLAAGWLGSLRAFVRADLIRIFREGWIPAAFEEPVEASLDPGGGAPVRVRGRFDRRLMRDGRARIGDYKTSGDLTRRVNPTVMLKGQTLQVPLYRALAGEGTSVELLGVSPEFDPEDDLSRPRFEGFEETAERRGFLETLRVLLGFLERGGFPLHKDRHCSWCPYDLACRRNHPPTQAREERDPDGVLHRLLLKKNRREPTLADVRGRT